MPRITILTEAELRRLLPLDAEALSCVERAFAALARGTAVVPPLLRLDIASYRGEVDVKTAYVPGLDHFAVKISPGFLDNPRLGLPSRNALMVVLSARTGLIEALLLDNGFLTGLRTAAAGAVAARLLSRPDASVAAVFGAGVQAQLQLEALCLVRPIAEARVWARRPEQARIAAAALTHRLQIQVRACPEPQAALRGADVVITATPARTPVLRNAWLSPGQHVTAMGADAEHKNELDPAIIPRARPYVADSLTQTRRCGELHHAIAAGLVAADAAFPELGAVITGRAAARTSPEAITVCDLTGSGVQDTAFAGLALRRATAAGAGTTFDTG